MSELWQARRRANSAIRIVYDVNVYSNFEVSRATYGQSEGHLRGTFLDFEHGEGAKLELVLSVPVIVLRRQVRRRLVCQTLLPFQHFIELIVEFLECRV